MRVAFCVLLYVMFMFDQWNPNNEAIKIEKETNNNQ